MLSLLFIGALVGASLRNFLRGRVPRLLRRAAAAARTSAMLVLFVSEILGLFSLSSALLIRGTICRTSTAGFITEAMGAVRRRRSPGANRAAEDARLHVLPEPPRGRVPDERGVDVRFAQGGPRDRRGRPRRVLGRDGADAYARSLGGVRPDRKRDGCSRKGGKTATD